LQKKYHIWINTGNKFHVCIKKYDEKLKSLVKMLHVMTTGMMTDLIPPPQPFYDHFSGTTRVSRCQKRNFWTLWCKGRITEADTLTILPYFFTGRMPFLPPNQQCQSTEGK